MRMVRYTLLVGALLLVSSLPLVDLIPGVEWHDQQRIGQVLVMAIALLVAITTLAGSAPPPLLDAGRRRLLAVIAAVGVCSALLARQPLWGLAEVALAVGACGTAWLVAVTRRDLGSRADHVLLAALCFTCAGLVSRFLASYLAGIGGEAGVLDAWLLVGGFSNPRFFGQFLTLCLPMLVVPLMLEKGLRRHAWPAGVLAVLAWTAVITSGTRGTWLGMTFAVVCLSCIGPAGRRWAGLQMTAAAIGAALFLLGMTVVPHMLGIEVVNHAGSRLNSSLSAREIIWQQAVETIIQHPLLGIGPMHLADLPNGVAAHPHQAWLQWAAEWGLPSALAVTLLAGYGAWAVFTVLRDRRGSRREEDVLRLCLAGALTASLAQAMVDGVLVMPYSQLWVALLGGWLLALQPGKTAQHGTHRPMRELAGWGTAFAASVAMLAFVAVRDYPHLQERADAFTRSLGGHLQPRFWMQGVINVTGNGRLASDTGRIR